VIKGRDFSGEIEVEKKKFRREWVRGLGKSTTVTGGKRRGSGCARQPSLSSCEGQAIPTVQRGKGEVHAQSSEFHGDRRLKSQQQRGKGRYREGKDDL